VATPPSVLLELPPPSGIIPHFFTSISDEDLGESAPTDQAQRPRRMTRSIPQDTTLGQDSPATASAPSLPQRTTRSRAQALGA